MKYPLSEMFSRSDHDPDQLRIVLIGSAERVAAFRKRRAKAAAQEAEKV